MQRKPSADRWRTLKRLILPILFARFVNSTMYQIYSGTVSGGSIVGASYAMGMSAENFRDHLKQAKPGLPNDLINFYPVFAQLFVPGYGSGDTYADHFDRVYFQGRQLGQTGPPSLIVNTTRYRDGTRLAEAYLPELCASAAFACRPVALGAPPTTPR